MIYQPEKECMSRDELHALQGKRLVETVKWTYDNVAMYRQRMDEAGIKPATLKALTTLQSFLSLKKKICVQTFHLVCLLHHKKTLCAFKVLLEQLDTQLLLATRKAM